MPLWMQIEQVADEWAFAASALGMQRHGQSPIS
jgi:hypothetical protein